MLVLTRKFGEDILIGDDIRIRVLPGSGGRIRLGIIAPKEVSVVRPEKSWLMDRSAPATRPRA